jgi:hypothetical protein
VHRTQLYLEDEVWRALKVRSSQSGLTISELVRAAVRDRYFGQTHQRKQAMLAFAGSRKDRSDIGNTEAYVRKLRKGRRFERLAR